MVLPRKIGVFFLHKRKMLVDKNNRCSPQMLKRSQKHKTSTQEQLCTKSGDPLGIDETQMRTQGLRDSCPQHVGCKHLFFGNWFGPSWPVSCCSSKKFALSRPDPRDPIAEVNLQNSRMSFCLSFFHLIDSGLISSPTLIPSPHTYTCFSIDVTQ